MPRETLFQLLSRSPWWVSELVACALFALVQLFLPAIVAFATALPFVGIGVYAAWRQLRAPSGANVAAALEKIRSMSWESFSAVIQEAFRRDGYEVFELGRGAADFELRKGGKVAIASCKRWKVVQTGVGPLRELYEEMRSRDAQEGIYVSAGDFTPTAREFAAGKPLRLLNDRPLGALVARVEGRRWLSFFR
jgi:restriction system protein